MFGRTWLRFTPGRRRASVYVAAILGILVLRAVLDVWAGQHLRAVSARIAPAYGGRLDAASLRPAEVAPGENRARIVAAACALTDLSRSPRGRERFTQALLGFPADPKARLEVFRQAMVDNRLALLVLDEIESRPKANFEIPYQDGFRAPFPPLAAIRDLGNLNAGAARIAAADGGADEAMRRARIGLALAGSLAREPSLLIQLIHIAVGREQLRLVQDVLASTDPSTALLESLASRLDEERAGTPVVVGLVGELKIRNSTFGGWEDGSTPSHAQLEDLWSRALMWFVRPAVRVGHARGLEDLDRTIQYARLRPFERESRGLRLPVDEPQPWWWRKISPMFLAGLERAIRSGDEQRAIFVLASTAVALRRCRLERGSYPESLEELAPVFLPDVPVDPYTGREPDYSRLRAGFTLRVPAPAGTADATRELLNWSIPR